MDFTADASPGQLARAAGALYLVNIVLGAFAIGVVPAMLSVPGDPAATAHNIQAHELLYRLGLAAHVMVVLTNVPLAVIFYDLFRVVDRRVALLVAFFTLVGTAVEAAGLLGQFAPILLLGGAPYAGTVPEAQLQALAYLPGDLSPIGYSITEVFFGCYAICLSYLVIRSRFLPGAIGGLMAIDGLAYLVYSFADLVAPGFAAHLVPWIQLPVLAGEGSLCLWLLIAGVDVERWTERASAALGAWSAPKGDLQVTAR
jgi:hypothetical protein